MKIIECKEEDFRHDFMPMIIDLWCGDKFDCQNPQHTQWLNKRIHGAFINFGVALCAYTDENEPIGYIWYRHDTGMEGVCFSGKDAHIIQMGLFEEYQRRGIGTKLLEEACRRIRKTAASASIPIHTPLTKTQ